MFGLLIVHSSIRALVKLFASHMKAKVKVYAVELLLEERKNCDLKMSNGEASNIIKSACDNVSSFIEMSIIKVFCPILSSIFIILYIAMISPLAFAILIATLILLSIAMFGRIYFDGKVYRKVEDINGKINNHVLNDIENLSFISFLKRKQHEIKITKQLCKNFYDTDRKRVVYYILYWVSVYLIEFACAVLVVLMFINSGLTNAKLASTLIVIIPYLLNIFNQVENFAFIIGECQGYGILISRIMLIKVNDESLVKNIVPTSSNNLISVERFPSKDKIAKLDVVDLKTKVGSFENKYNATFYKGKLNCIVGESGSGKTTLINSMLGIIDHDAGNIIVNDKYKLNNLYFESDRVSIAYKEIISLTEV